MPPAGGVGNPGGHAAVPAEAALVDVAHPTTVIGSGTPASCTSAAVVAAVKKGGVVTFNCGPTPVSITMTETAKVVNANERLVIDGGGKVTLSGDGKRRILYQDTCDQAQGWTTSHCDDQATPLLVLQNLTFADGNSSATDNRGGGAVLVGGGQVKVINSRFVRNTCNATGPDVAGGALRLIMTTAPDYIVNSTFGGSAADANTCSNGGAVAGLQARNIVILNSLFTNNAAVGRGANPARAGTPGGGNGGAIYSDGMKLSLSVKGSLVQDNTANEGGGALFYTSNDGQGPLFLLDSSVLRHNPDTPWMNTPGMFVKGTKEYGQEPLTMDMLKRYLVNTTIQ